MIRKYERHERILQELRARPTVRISELAEEFGVTKETVRRDVDELSNKGLVDRTYGGAAITPLGTEPKIAAREAVFQKERSRIAKCALSLVSADEILMIDAGSTTTEFASRLAASILDSSTARITVITNCINVARALGPAKSIRTMLCPGDYTDHENAVFGPDTIDYIRQFRANTAIIGANGVSHEGVAEVNPDGSRVKRAMIDRVDRVVLLVDKRKFGVNAFSMVCDLEKIDHLVTDDTPPADLSSALDESGVIVHVAD